MSISSKMNSLRASHLPTKNQQLSSINEQIKGHDQGDLVMAKGLDRIKKRQGLKIQELGATKISKVINSMNDVELSSYLTSILKSHKVIVRITLYKEQSLKDDKFREENTNYTTLPLGFKVKNSISLSADKIASEYVKMNVAGIDMDGEGNFYVYYWNEKRPTSIPEKPKVAETTAGPKKKDKKKDDKKDDKKVEAKEKEKEETKVQAPKDETHPVILLYYYQQ